MLIFPPAHPCPKPRKTLSTGTQRENPFRVRCRAHLTLRAGQGLGQVMPLGKGLEKGQEVTGSNGFPEAVGVVPAASLHIASLHVLGHDVFLACSPAGRGAWMGMDLAGGALCSCLLLKPQDQG